MDAYGEEEIWKDTFEIPYLNPCDEAAIVQIAIVLVGVAIDLTADVTIPWTALITMVKTIDSICQLVEIHNEWVDCYKKMNQQSSGVTII